MKLFASRRVQPEEEEDSDSGEEEGKERPTKKQKVQDGMDEDMGQMNAVQCWLRQRVPPEAVLPSEKLLFEHKGTEFEDYTAHNTASVDGFLYSEADVDDLCDAGKLSRSYCRECGSRNTAPLNFISHSLSIAELRFLMQSALPAVCKPKQSSLLDVGSRLGAVLFSSSILGNFKQSTGVELNADLCKVQEEAVRAFGLQDKVSVVCGDIKDNCKLVSDAQVVVLHNAFQFFVAPEESLSCWRAIAAATTPGTWIVACPSLEEQLACCSGGGKSTKKKGKKKAGAAASSELDLGAWVEEHCMDYPTAEFEDDEYADEKGVLFTNIRLYRVRAALPAA